MFLTLLAFLAGSMGTKIQPFSARKDWLPQLHHMYFKLI